jgi:hypothetical protein
MKGNRSVRDSNPDLLRDSPERWPLDHDGLMGIMTILLILNYLNFSSSSKKQSLRHKTIPGAATNARGSKIAPGDPRGVQERPGGPSGGMINFYAFKLLKSFS